MAKKKKQNVVDEKNESKAMPTAEATTDDSDSTAQPMAQAEKSESDTSGYIGDLDAVDNSSEFIDTDEYYFEPIDVSEPRPQRKEIDILEEELALRRKTWMKQHSLFIYAGIGVVLVLLVFFIMFQNYRSSNPTSRFFSMFAKTFNTSFTYDVDMSENDESVMSYHGYLDIDRRSHRIKATYNAHYTDYDYESAIYSDGTTAYRGLKYDGEWKIRDITEKTSDFFDFDTDFANGSFDAGAFLRFFGLSSDYSSIELQKYMKKIGSKLTTDSSVATVTSSQNDDGSHIYTYNINLYYILSDIAENGAPIFYRSGDYDLYRNKFRLNEDNIKNSSAVLSFTENKDGYATDIQADITVGGIKYTLSAALSDFGKSADKIELPSGFIEAAKIDTKSTE